MATKAKLRSVTLGLILVGAASGLSGCGAFKAIDSVNSMPDAIKNTNDAVGGMSGKMDTTNGAIHDQTLLVALTELRKKENQATLFPPTMLTPAGKKFAENLHADELADFVFNEMLDISEKQLGDVTQMTDAQKAQWDHDKQAQLMILQVVTGFIPQDLDLPHDQRKQLVIEKMVQDQITEHGLREDAAYQALFFRAMFIQTFLLDETLLRQEPALTNPGKLKEAFLRISQLDYLAKLPFVGKIRVKTSVMVDPENDVDAQLDPEVTRPYWKRLREAFDTELAPEYRSLPEVQELKQKVDQTAGMP